MAVLILDPTLEKRVRAERGDKTRDEVWDGVLVMSPEANLEHQDFGGELAFIFRSALGSRRAGRVYPGVNVSDRDEGWLENFRIPDVAVYLAGNPALSRVTHYVGGPDLAVEIISRFDRARDKSTFYANIGVREFLVIDRDPWVIELYRPEGGAMVMVARTTPNGGDPVRLDVPPLILQFVAGADQPTIEVVHETDGRRWTIGD